MLYKVLACFMPITFASGCSIAQEGPALTVTEPDMLAGIPEDANGRFIITLKNTGPGTIEQRMIEEAVKSLEESGAISVQHFEGLPTLIVESDRTAIERLIESDVVEAVQVDQLSTQN